MVGTSFHLLGSRGPLSLFWLIPTSHDLAETVGVPLRAHSSPEVDFLEQRSPMIEILHNPFMVLLPLFRPCLNCCQPDCFVRYHLIARGPKALMEIDPYEADASLQIFLCGFFGLDLVACAKRARPAWRPCGQSKASATIVLSIAT